MSSGLTFDLSIDPNVRFVSTVRRFVEASLERTVADPDTVFRVALTAHELLENAGKYCATGNVQLRFSVRLEGPKAVIDLALCNETTAAHIARLGDTISAIAAAGDPFAYYQDLLREPTRCRDEAGLGLARIAAEADMRLGLEVVGSTVAVTATTTARLPARQGAEPASGERDFSLSIDHPRGGRAVG
jgi:two-component sensor histidine kinase